MIRKIATATVYVDDPEKAGSSLRPPGAESCLVIYPKSMMENWAERKPSIVFECSDVQTTYDVMKKRGVEFRQPSTPMPWGPFAIFVDPEGNWFGLRGGAAVPSHEA
jgi:hypothetical protein